MDEFDENNNKVINILKHIVVIEPRERFSAAQCLDEGCYSSLYRVDTKGEFSAGEVSGSSDDEDKRDRVRSETSLGEDSPNIDSSWCHQVKDKEMPTIIETSEEAFISAREGPHA